MQHAAASTTKERVKSLLPRHPVATAARPPSAEYPPATRWPPPRRYCPLLTTSYCPLLTTPTVRQVATAALLRNPELAARFDAELFSLTVNELLPTLQGLLTTGGARVAQVDMYTLTSTAASLTVTLNDATLVQRLLWLPSSGFALWSAEAEGPHAAAYRAYGPLLTTPPEAEGPHAPAGGAQLACIRKADMRYDFKDAVLRLRCELAYIPR